MQFSDRVKETTTVSSTSTINLAGAPSGFRSFAAGFSVGTIGIPVCVSDSAGNWEIGTYTLTSSNTLTRTYVQSSSQGNGAVNFPAGTTKDVFCVVPASALASWLLNPDDVGFDIVLCAGQSNMEGYPPSDPLIDKDDPRVFQYSIPFGDATRHQILSTIEPLYMTGGVRTGKTGPASWFGKAYASTLPSNRKVLLIPCASGGTGLVNPIDWQAGATTGLQLYNRAVTEANAAIAEAIKLYPNSRFVGVIWAQGETDAANSVSQAAYASALKAVIAGFRSGITGAANSWFIISSMTPSARSTVYGAAKFDPIDAAHKQVVAEVDRCAFVPSIAGMDNNSEHYSSAGIRIIGTRMGLAVATAKYAKAIADVTAPTIVSASVANATPSTVTVTFSEPIDTASIPAVADLASSIAGHTVTSVTAGPNSLTLGVGTPFAYGEAARSFVYTKPATGFIKDLAGNPLADGATYAISNNVNAAATVPDAPTIGTAVAGDGYVDVAFTAPGNNGGSAILDYTATLSTGETATGTTSPIRVTATNGTSRTATVKARNAVGSSASSAASNSVTPAAAGQGGGGGTFNTMSATDKNAGLTVTGNGLIVTSTASGFISARASAGKTTGKYQFEAKMTAGTSGVVGIGIASTPLNSFPGGDNPAAASTGYYTAGQRYESNGVVGSPATWTTNDVIGIVVDLDARTGQFYKNGVLQVVGAAGATTFNLPSGMVTALNAGNGVFPMVSTNGNAYSFTLNFGATSFAFPVAGYAGWPA